MRILLTAAMVAMAFPAAAQSAGDSAPRQRFISILEGERCPKSEDPNEVIVCGVVKPEEQFRIPQGLRTPPATARKDDVPGSRTALVDARVGGGLCSGAGTQGQFGCNQGVGVVGVGAGGLSGAAGAAVNAATDDDIADPVEVP